MIKAKKTRLTIGRIRRNIARRWQFFKWFLGAEDSEDRLTFFAFLVGPARDLEPMIDAELACRWAKFRDSIE